MTTRKRRRRIGSYLLLLFFVFIAFLVYDSNTRIVVQDYTIQNAKLPASFDGFRITQLSDIHTAQFGTGNSKLIAAVIKSRPNIIVITGDLVNSSDEIDSALLIVEPLVKTLVSIAPVYYVTGNHEWELVGLPKLFTMLEQTGVTVLRNDYTQLIIGDESIILAGIDDPNGPADMKMPEALVSEIKNRETNPFIVVLAHRNNLLHRFAALDIDLFFCGHAHGGLVRLPFVGALIGPSRELFPKYTNGLYTEGSTDMLVSRGIGNGTGTLRFLNNPHIPVAVLRAS